jgi:hypothetical protein
VIARVTGADGSRSTEPVIATDPATGAPIPDPIRFGPEDDRLFLTLFGTGLRRADPAVVSAQIEQRTHQFCLPARKEQSRGLIKSTLPRPSR